MATAKGQDSGVVPRITRWRFLQLATGGLAWLAAGPRPASAATYRVGVGKLTDPYAATRRAVKVGSEWPVKAIQPEGK